MGLTPLNLENLSNPASQGPLHTCERDVSAPLNLQDQ